MDIVVVDQIQELKEIDIEKKIAQEQWDIIFKEALENNNCIVTEAVVNSVVALMKAYIKIYRS